MLNKIHINNKLSKLLFTFKTSESIILHFPQIISVCTIQVILIRCHSLNIYQTSENKTINSDVYMKANHEMEYKLNNQKKYYLNTFD